MTALEIPADPRGRRSQQRTAWGLLVLSALAVAGGLVFGGTKVAGVELPGWAGVAAGTLLAPLGIMMLRWSLGRAGDPALSTHGDILVVGAHAGPALRIRRDDILGVEQVRPSGSSTEAVAFGSHVFFVRSGVEVSPGVRTVPIGSKYVDTDLVDVRQQLVAWVKGPPSA